MDRRNVLDDDVPGRNTANAKQVQLMQLSMHVEIDNTHSCHLWMDAKYLARIFQTS